jgi:hypothetical protein
LTVSLLFLFLLQSPMHKVRKPRDGNVGHSGIADCAVILLITCIGADSVCSSLDAPYGMVVVKRGADE